VSDYVGEKTCVRSSVSIGVILWHILRTCNARQKTSRQTVALAVKSFAWLTQLTSPKCYIVFCCRRDYDRNHVCFRLGPNFSPPHPLPFSLGLFRLRGIMSRPDELHVVPSPLFCLLHQHCRSVNPRHPVNYLSIHYHLTPTLSIPLFAELQYNAISSHLVHIPPSLATSSHHLHPGFPPPFSPLSIMSPSCIVSDRALVCVALASGLFLGLLSG
jgi:hypothetical protein